MAQLFLTLLIFFSKDFIPNPIIIKDSYNDANPLFDDQVDYFVVAVAFLEVDAPFLSP